MKRILSMIMLLALVFSGCGSEAPSSEAVEAAAEPSVTVLGRISSISGNDVAMTLGTYGTTQDSGTQAVSNGQDTTMDGATEDGANRRTRSDSAEDNAPGEAAAPAGNSGAPEGGAPPDDAGGAGGGASAEGGSGGEGSGRTAVKFKESGESWSGRIPVGTPIQYGTLKVDFSQLQVNYIVSLALGGPDGTTVVSGEILSTS